MMIRASGQEKNALCSTLHPQYIIWIRILELSEIKILNDVILLRKLFPSKFQHAIIYQVDLQLELLLNIKPGRFLDV